MELRQAIELTEAQRNQLIRARERAGLSQEALAQAVGVSRPMVAMLESGQKPAPMALLERLAGRLGLEFSVKLAVKLAPKKSRKNS